MVALTTSTANGTQAFTDVDDDRFYADAAVWANNNGITTGCGDGYHDNIVRPALGGVVRHGEIILVHGTTRSLPTRHVHPPP